MAPARHRVKLGQLSTGIVESGRMLVRSRKLRWRGKSGGQQGNWRTLRVQVRVVVKIFGRVVGCGTGLTRFDEDRGVPLEGVRGFHGKIHLGEPICVTGQEGASSDKISHCERRLLTACFHWR